jgi:hypothetical protein
MKIYWHMAPHQPKEYSLTLVRGLMQKYGTEEVTDPRNADLVCASVCDVDETGIAVAARKHGKPTLVGGFVSYMPYIRFAADYVCTGEAYGLAKAMGRLTRPEDLASLPMVGTRTKQGVLDEAIEWRENPIVRVSKTAFYWYSGKGCKGRCKYCALGWSRTWNQAPEGLYRNVLKAIPKGGKLYPMASMLTYGPTSDDSKLGSCDVRLREYAAGDYSHLKRIRAGVEFFTPALRAAFGKSISDQAIYDAILNTGKHGAQAMLYFIVGVPGDDPRHFLDVVPMQTDLTPHIKLGLTYLDPQPGTPIADWDLREKVAFDGKWFARAAVARNRRLRVQGPKYMAHSTWRTIMQRATCQDEFNFAWSQRNQTDHETILKETDRSNYRLLGASPMRDLIRL